MKHANHQIKHRITEETTSNNEYTNKNTEEVYWLKGAIVLCKR